MGRVTVLDRSGDTTASLCLGRRFTAIPELVLPFGVLCKVAAPLWSRRLGCSGSRVQLLRNCDSREPVSVSDGGCGDGFGSFLGRVDNHVHVEVSGDLAVQLD
jgi:hypothetical protein